MPADQIELVRLDELLVVDKAVHADLVRSRVGSHLPGRLVLGVGAGIVVTGAMHRDADETAPAENQFAGRAVTAAVREKLLFDRECHLYPSIVPVGACRRSG